MHIDGTRQADGTLQIEGALHALGIRQAPRASVAASIRRHHLEVETPWRLIAATSIAGVRGAVTLVGGRAPTEASGGVTLQTIRAIAETGVDYISVGRITQSAPAADIGLDFKAA